MILSLGPGVPVRKATKCFKIDRVAMDLPNLSRLKRMEVDALTDSADGDGYAIPEDGLYCLDALRAQKGYDGTVSVREPEELDSCNSSLILLRQAIHTDENEHAGAFEFMQSDKVPKTRNVYNKNTFLLRKQITFGATYKNYTSKPLDDDDTPELVNHVLQYTKDLIRNNPNYFHWPPGVTANHYNAVHCNYYPCGKSGVAVHQDAESEMIAGMPIFSYTFLAKIDASSNVEVCPREFEITTKHGEQKYTAGGRPTTVYTPHRVAGVTLTDGDLLIMQGGVQKEWFHRVTEGKPPALHKNTRRINMTVRAFTESFFPEQSGSPST